MDFNPLKVEDRLLWPDGYISVKPEQLSQYIIKLGPKKLLNKLAVTDVTPEVEEYNSFGEVQLQVKSEIDLSLFPPHWSLPDAYKYLDLDEHLIGLGNKIEQDELYEQRVERLAQEIFIFKKLQLDDVLKMLIYVVDRLNEAKAVWGVGRGSSCSSYLLFLLGLHEVDPVRYDIELADFIREEN